VHNGSGDMRYAEREASPAGRSGAAPLITGAAAYAFAGRRSRRRGAREVPSKSTQQARRVIEVMADEAVHCRRVRRAARRRGRGYCAAAAAFQRASSRCGARTVSCLICAAQMCTAMQCGSTRKRCRMSLPFRAKRECARVCAEEGVFSQATRARVRRAMRRVLRRRPQRCSEKSVAAHGA